jgi:hypothetical protein
LKVLQARLSGSLARSFGPEDIEMLDKFTLPISAKHAAKVGMGAARGFQNSSLAANAISRIPGVGPALSLAFRAGSTLHGAMEAFNDHSDD